MLFADLHSGSRVSIQASSLNEYTSLIRAAKQIPYYKAAKKEKKIIISIYDFCLLKSKIAKFDKNKRIMSQKLKNKISDIYSLADLPDFSNLKRPLLFFQEDGVRFLLNRKSALLADQMGLGKGHSIGTKILTPNGWKNVEELTVGDEIIGSNGLPTKVNNIYKRGKLDIYEIYFNDRTHVKCDIDHLWKVESVQYGGRNKWMIKSVRELIKDGLKYINGNRKWRIPMVKPIEFNFCREFVIEPYLLGVLLGDGSISNHPVRFTSLGDDIANEVRKILPEKFSLKGKKYKRNAKINDWVIKTNPQPSKNPILDELRNLDLFGCRSFEKFIPEKYLFSSVKSRISLLQGLMDTDGGKGEVTVFYSSSKQLAKQVCFLVESLGGNARLTVKKKPYYYYKGEKKCGLPNYRVTMSLPVHINPFRAFASSYGGRTKYFPTRIIDRIEKTNLKEEVICISVDSEDSLYVTEHCIVTHNTAISITAAKILIDSRKVKKFFCLVKSSALYHWHNEFKITYGNDIKVVVVDDKNYTNRIKTYLSNNEFFIVSLDTFKTDIYKLFRHINWMEVGIILDEAHSIKNLKTKRFKACKKISDLVLYKWALTGTPMDGTLESTFGIMTFLDNDFFVNFDCFDRHHLVRNFFGVVIDYINIDDLKLKLEPIMLRRRKEEVLKDLPPKIYNTLWISLSLKEKKLYNDLKRQNISLSTKELSNKINNNQQIALIIYAQELVNAPVLIDPRLDFPSSKMRELLDLLEEIFSTDEDAKVVIFSKYARMCHILNDWLPWSSVIYTGEKTAKEREKIRLDFLTNDDTKIFIMDEAGAVSIDLHGINIKGEWKNGADYLIFYDRLWNPNMNEQIEDRIHRLGKDRPVNIISFLTVGTIEERVNEVLKKKSELTYRVVDEKINEDDALKLL